MRYSITIHYYTHRDDNRFYCDSVVKLVDISVDAALKRAAELLPPTQRETQRQRMITEIVEILEKP